MAIILENGADKKVLLEPFKYREDKVIRVIVVDDHYLIRRGLKHYIELLKDIEFVAEAGTGAELLQLCSYKTCDVVLLDLELPDKNGIEVVKEVKKIYPGVQVLMLSMHPEERYAKRALESGASGYITKGSSPEELEKAIRKAAAGGRYISEAMAEELASEIVDKQEVLPHKRLSDREFFVLVRLGRGDSVKNIGSSLHISVSTVHTYKQRVMEKLKFGNTAELIHYVYRHNLIER